MLIGKREIGPSQPPYIIAEIGVNHDGSVERALQLVDAAADAEADAVKLQLFKADLLMSKAAKLAAYQKAAGESDPIEMLRRLELSIDQMRPIVERAHARGIHAIVTVFSLELIAEAEKLAWDAYKTASPDIIHRPLLEALMATGKPLIVSTGASTLEEVTRAAEWLKPAHQRLAVLQCVSCYPTPRQHGEFGGILALRDALELPIGYSDHTPGAIEGSFAVALGACVLEKHFTHSRKAPGPDHAASLEAPDFEFYARQARSAARARTIHLAPTQFTRVPDDENDPKIQPSFDEAAMELLRTQTVFERVKRVIDIEQDVRRVSRQSIVTKHSLPIGHTLASADLTFKRPGTGIEPFRLSEVIGRRLVRSVEADMPLMEADLG